MNGQLIAAAAIGAIALSIGAGVLAGRNAPEPSAVTPAADSGVTTRIEAPGVRVDTGGDDGSTRVEAPFTKVEKSATGTRIEAPGVDITVPSR